MTSVPTLTIHFNLNNYLKNFIEWHIIFWTNVNYISTGPPMRGFQSLVISLCRGRIEVTYICKSQKRWTQERRRPFWNYSYRITPQRAACRYKWGWPFSWKWPYGAIPACRYKPRYAFPRNFCPFSYTLYHSNMSNT